MSLKYYDSKRLKAFMIKLFGPQAHGWTMNDDIFNLTYQLVYESGKCSSAMGFVPLPINPFGNALRQLGKDAIKKFIKALSDNEEHYFSCLRVAAVNMKTEFVMAGRRG